MMMWVFVGVTLSACATATLVGNIRRAALALWVASLGVGGIYLTMGAELLAVIQWVVSTLVAISFVFFSVMFGEYHQKDKRPLREKILPTAMAFAVGIAFFWMIWLGVSGLPEGAATVPAEGNDLLSIGKALTEEHMLSLEVLALTLFLVLIGAGVIARPEASDR